MMTHLREASGRRCGLWSTNFIVGFFFFISIFCSFKSSAEQWSPEAIDRPAHMPTLQSLDVTCYKNHMTVTAQFSGSFQGTIFSKGSSGQQGCVYVAPHSGGNHYQFDIQYDKCGTKPDLNGKLYENTIVVQYGSDLIEVWDEAKRLRCEWFNDYQKTQAANPPVRIDDLEEVQQDFVGDHVEVWMEIQEGRGPWASQVSGIVPLGSTLTLVVAINDPSNEFDMLVRSCVASDGVRPPLLLSDEFGCVMRPKMFGPFQKMKVQDARATVITYAHFQAFKFPDALSVQLQCRVMICRHGCPEHCQQNGNGQAPPPSFDAHIQSRIDGPEVSTPSTSSFVPEISTEKQVVMDKAEALADGKLIPGPRNIRIRRETVSSAEEYGVSQLFMAISRTDLAFSPSSADSVAVFAGHMARDGTLCIPTARFTLMLVLLATLAIIAVGAAAVLSYRYCSTVLSKPVSTSNNVPHVPSTVWHITQRSRSKVQ